MAYIIAEVGSNYDNSSDAIDSIVAAKRCGADAVKFQMFTPEELYGSERCGDPRGVPRDWIGTLREKADMVGIDFLCTAFSPEGVEFLNPFVVAHKVASSDSNYMPLLEAVKATGKRAFVSTGGSYIQDIRDTIDCFGKDNLTLMYCRSEYPSVSHDLRLINVIRNEFNIDVGYSCHTIDVYTPVAAVQQHGATCIEKHFKLRVDMATPDSGHSLCPREFYDMVNRIHDTQRLIDIITPAKGMTLRHNRRPIAIDKISKGDEFVYGVNWGYFRSRRDAVSPRGMTDVIARDNYNIGDAII
jgi:pseudaminic acid synthase